MCVTALCEIIVTEPEILNIIQHLDKLSGPGID